jgi:hypothetical protein
MRLEYKIRRFLNLFSTRGVLWSVVNILAELKFFPFLANYISSILNNKLFRSFLLGLGGSSVNQLWKERQATFERVISDYVSEFKKGHTSGIKIIEIGSWAGAGSTPLFRRLIKQNGQLVQIDKWGSDYAGAENHISQSAKLMSQNVFNAQILNSINNEEHGFEVSSRITTIRSTPKNLNSLLSFLPTFDIIYLDGSHIYEDVKEDINFALKAIKSKGLLCGDDLEIGINPVYLDQAREERHQDLIVFEDGSAFHPGVYLALLESGLKINHENGFWWLIVD